MYASAPIFKDGTRHFTGLEETILKNIDACNELTKLTRTSLGPNGMNKLVVNRLEKIFVTNDAATVLKELDVVHPAAKMLVMAAEMQEQECGDGTNFVLAFAGELLQQAESLIRMNLHPNDIITGFKKASQKALEIVEELSVLKVDDVRDEAKVSNALKTAVSSKQIGLEDFLAPLIAKACIQVCPKEQKNFNVDNVRTVKILGGGAGDSTLIKGFVVEKDSEGTTKHVKNAKIAVYTGGIEANKPETKGTVLFKTADQLEGYTASEEIQMENIIKNIAAAGINVIVTGGSISDIGVHFIEKYKLMAVKVQSKFALRRLCKAIGATALVRLVPPSADEVGKADIVTVEELGSTKVTIFRQEKEDSAISSIVLRGSTQNILDSLERTIDDGVNVYKGLCRDGRLLAGGGAAEIEIALRLQKIADSTPGLDQYAIKKFSESFEVVPRILADNAGLNSTSLISTLYAAHQSGKTNLGVDVEVFSHNLWMEVISSHHSRRSALFKIWSREVCMITSSLNSGGLGSPRMSS
eukprot:TRINITY_DN706_c0_g1_i11.p1 TRINITY_DN706_c0_g1~~TRINITY_DN706_c0_g1_i11.p1  ORF type:complete len:538 (+),score=114.03 TRINITY_DN706_c0_g1_i11:38-1615(+)